MANPDLLDRGSSALIGNFNPKPRITLEIRQRTEDLRQRAINLLENPGSKPFLTFFNLDEEKAAALSVEAEQLAKKDEASFVRRIPILGFIARSLGGERMTIARRRAEDYELALECIRLSPFRIVEANVSGTNIAIASVHPALETTVVLMMEHALSSREIDDWTKNVAQVMSVNQCIIRVGSSKWKDLDGILRNRYIALLPPEDYDNPTLLQPTLYPEDRALRRLTQAEKVINILSSAPRDQQ